MPAWKANARTCVKVSIGSGSRSGGRAVASGSGCLYIQTGIAPGAVTVYGPYTPTDSVYGITDIPAGTHKPFIFLYTQSVPTAGVIALAPADATKSGYLAALQNLWQTDPASRDGSSFGYLDSVAVLSGRDTVIHATLVPTTDISVSGSGSQTIPGIAGQSVRRFVKITGMKAAFPGLDPATSKMTCSLSTPTADPVTVSAVGLYDSTGAKIKYDLSASTLNVGNTRVIDAVWTGDDTYYLYADFTGSSFQCSFSAAPIPTHTVTFDLNGGSGTMASMTMFEGFSANLSACTFTKSGYSCIGWSTTAGSTTPTYANGASFTMGTSDVTLYAIWADTTAPVISSITLGSTTYLECNVTEKGSGLKSISLSGDVQSPIAVTFTSYGSMVPSSASGTTITLAPVMQCDGRVFVLSGYIPSAGSGLKTIYVSMTDGAGNVSAVSSASITVP